MTRRARLVLSAIIAAAVIGLLGAGLARLAGGKAAGLPVVGQVIPAAQRPRAPDISGTTLTGRHLTIASWHGHTVVINFWLTRDASAAGARSLDAPQREAQPAAGTDQAG